MPKAAAKAPWEVAIERLAATVSESAKEMAEFRKIMGAHTTEEGEMLENDVAAAIVKDMALGGVKFDEVITNAHVHHGKHGDGEFDWIGINGKIIMVGETRRTLERGAVRHFVADRMELFRRAFWRYAKGREVQGVLIYQKAKAGAVEEALKLKMKVFRAEDDKTLRPVKTAADIPKRTNTKSHKRQKGAALE